MLIRIKLDRKSRRLPEKVQTIAELKKKVYELFELAQGTKLKIVYKDADNESVNVIDDEDLNNCYLEAKDLNRETLTFLVEVGDANQGSKGEDCDKEDNFGSKEGEINTLKNTISKLHMLSRICIRDGNEDPISSLRAALSEAEESCPGLSSNPKLLGLTFGLAKAELTQAIKKGYEEAVKKQPELLKFNDESEKKWKDLTQTGLTSSFKPTKPGRNDQDFLNMNERENRKETFDNHDRGYQHHQNRDRERDYDGGSFRGGYREGDRGGRGGPWHPRHRDHDRPYRGGGRFGGDRRGYRNNDRQDFRRDDQETREKILTLCRRFPNRTKAELASVVHQNPDRPISFLESAILQNRKSKSSYY